MTRHAASFISSVTNGLNATTRLANASPPYDPAAVPAVRVGYYASMSAHISITRRLPSSNADRARHSGPGGAAANPLVVHTRHLTVPESSLGLERLGWGAGGT